MHYKERKKSCLILVSEKSSKRLENYFGLILSVVSLSVFYFKSIVCKRFINSCF